MTTSRPAEPLSPQAATFLSTEHWSLLGTRSMTWNESFSRVSMFFNALSASVVALALVADATSFDRSFRVFALILLPLVFFLGVTTYVRVAEINLEEIFLVAAMNRLRRAYLDHAPELEPYFTTGAHDDAAGVWKTLLMDVPTMPRPFLHFLVTTPTVVGTVDAAIASAALALLAYHLGAAAGLVTLVAIIGFMVVWAGLMAVQLRHVRLLRENHAKLVRFPTTDPDAPRLF
jgi:hypothetical protein